MGSAQFSKGLEYLQYLAGRQCKGRSKLSDTNMNTNEIVRALRSGDLEEQDSAFKEITTLMATIAEEAVNAMRDSSSPVVVAENIFRVAYTFRSALEKLFSTTSSHELKSISATLLIQMGSRIGVEHLFDTVRKGADYDALAATSLAKADLRDAVPALVARLEDFDHMFYSKRENAPKINTFLVALKQLGGELPSRLKERL